MSDSGFGSRHLKFLLPAKTPRRVWSDSSCRMIWFSKNWKPLYFCTIRLPHKLGLWNWSPCKFQASVSAPPSKRFWLRDWLQPSKLAWDPGSGSTAMPVPNKPFLLICNTSIKQTFCWLRRSRGHEKHQFCVIVKVYSKDYG